MPRVIDHNHVTDQNQETDNNAKQGNANEERNNKGTKMLKKMGYNEPYPAEFEERRTNSDHRAAEGSLSDGTEAVVSRDAFEGMIETLSRTKASISRSTRQAIDCSNHGIANECSHTVQAALPRIPGAAASPGASARENRRQCLKVLAINVLQILKLWLERKVLPDSLLRSHIQNIGSSNDEASPSTHLDQSGL